MPTAIQFRNLSVTTPQGRLLLDNISVAVSEGSFTAVLGRSGSGKTTLLRTVNHMVTPSSGEVLVHEKSVRLDDIVALRRTMGYVIQETGLFPHFSVERNVGLILEAQGRPLKERKQRSLALLEEVGLSPDDYADRYPHQLSGGQRQRVGVARALAADPSILLMDEPFGALDPLTRNEMQEMLLGLLARLQKTVLFVTHDLDEALFLADRILLLSNGKLVADLASSEFLNSQHPEAQEYIRAYHRGERESEHGRIPEEAQ